jgi:histone deacetylase complex regulatory component SIN3
MTKEEYKKLFIENISKYYKNGLLMKNGNVVEIASVFTIDDYMYVFLPEQIKKHYGVEGYLKALIYAEEMMNEDEQFASIVEIFKKGIAAANERYLIAKDGITYLKEMGKTLEGKGNVIVIEYRKNAESQ